MTHNVYNNEAIKDSKYNLLRYRDDRRSTYNDPQHFLARSIFDISN